MADSKGVELHAMGGAASPSRAMTYGELKAMREAREAAEAAAAAAPAPAAAAAGASAAGDLVLTPSSGGSPSPQHAPATPPGTRVGTGVSASAQRAAAAAGPSAAPTPARPLLLEPVNGSAAAAGGAAAPSSVHVELSAPALTHRPTMARSDEEAQLIGTLLTAAARNDLKRVEELITSRGVDANAGDYDRRTALHLASAEGHLVLVRLLVEKLGARVDVKDRFGHLPLDDAILHEHPTVVNFLRSRNAASGVLSRHQAELLVAASNGDCATVEKLLSMGVQPNCIGHDRRTPLHLAVADGRADVVELLLKAGADRHAHDRFHQTPADEAKQRAVRSGADPIHELFVQYTPEREREEAAKHRPCCSKFVFWFGWWEALIIVLFGVLADYAHESKGAVDPTTDEAANAITRIYPLYQDIHVMIFIGFGYLMTFLRKNGYSAVGYTFLVCAFVIQWYTLVEAFWGALFHGDWSTPVELNIRKLILSDFAGGAVMITYGAVLGKVSPLQLLFCAGFEVIFYALNERISLEMQIADIGGSMVIHMFGAFFGLAFSRMVTPLDKAKGNANNSAGYHSDIFAMIGTVFLWLFWPSFNGGLATGNTQHRAIVNTVLSLAGSCVAACVASYAVRRETRFNMVDVQNATLAGGVAMGTCADMLITPGAAIAIGAISGFVSVVGYVYVQPFLEHHISLHDTCGVNNLHGMPSIIGALAGVIASYEASVDKYGEQLPVIFPARMADGSGRSANDQAARQFAYIIITLSIAIASGTLVGAVVSRKEFDPPSDSLFLDAQYWEVPSKEEPYYFDARGEIAGHILQPAALRNRSATQVEQDAAAALQDMHPKLSHKHLEQRIEQLETQLAASYSRPGAAAAPAGGSVEQLAHTLQQVLEHLNKRA